MAARLQASHFLPPHQLRQQLESSLQQSYIQLGGLGCTGLERAGLMNEGHSATAIVWLAAGSGTNPLHLTLSAARCSFKDLALPHAVEGPRLHGPHMSRRHQCGVPYHWMPAGLIRSRFRLALL